MTDDTPSEVRELTREEGRELFDATARRRLGISGEEFLIRLDRGDYDDENCGDNPAIFALIMLIPFVR